jgi:hypothetical protein
MNLIDELVQHNKFGFGRVVNQTQKTVTVEFYSDPVVREFLLPAAFHSGLLLSDPLAQSELEYELSHPRRQPTDTRFDF